MKRLAFYSVVLMALGVALSACDMAPPASAPTPQSGPNKVRQKRMVFNISPLSGEPAVTEAQLATAQEIVRKRLEVMELVSPTVELSGTNLIVIVPGTADNEEVSDVLTQRGFIEFLTGSSNPPLTGVYITTELGEPDPDAKPVDTSGVIFTVVLTSEDLLTGGAKVETQSGMANLQIKMTAAGKTKLSDYTRTHTGTYMPIALDKYLLVTPMIQGEIPGGELALSGLQDSEIKGILAGVNSGVLPVRLTFTSVEVILSQ